MNISSASYRRGLMPKQMRFTGKQPPMTSSLNTVEPSPNSEFSAKYLPGLVAEYKNYTTLYNMAMIMINVVCHL